MISFRFSVIALSTALMFSVGSSASTATTNYSHPEFSVADGHTLNLRETSSQIVVETIENALRQGGLALLGEGFQLDSSLSYHSGDNEGIEGDLDVVIPLLNLGRHVLFVQPGAVFWTGLEEEERIDGNIGLVYRAELTRDLVTGASIFYDHDFQIGHSRVSGGLDLQSGFFRLGANYYHPLSEIEDGRDGFVEEALRGGDLQFAFERDVVRLGSTIGYWEYDGGENVEDEWKTSFGLDFGVRILPGVFAEASWERHKDNIVLDERIFAGLAFRFSLPDFEGASYGSGEMTSNLYKIVDREKRILYEERVGVPSVSIVRTGNETIAADTEVTIPVDVRLSEVLAEDVTINLVGSGMATYNDDYTVSVGGMDCPMVTEANCQVTITAGQLTPSGDVTITIIDDGRTNEQDESIILSMVVASPANTDLLPRGSVSLTIPEDPPLPTVSWSVDSTSIEEGDTATITFTLSEEIESDVTINLLQGGAATYGTGANDDWHLSVGGTDCGMASQTNLCQVVIADGDTTATAIVEVNEDMTFEPLEEFTVSVVIDSGSTSLVVTGSSSTLSFFIPAHLEPTISMSRSGGSSVTEGSVVTLTLTLSEVLTENVTINLLRGTGTATYGLQDWLMSVDNRNCSTATGTNCQVTIEAGRNTNEDIIRVNISDDDLVHSSEAAETFMVSIQIASAGSTGLILGDPSVLDFTIDAD